MGNSPSVSGLDRGGAHVEGDVTVDDHLAGQRPVKYNAADSGTELANSQTALETNRKSHFEVITEQPSGASNRKSSNVNVPRSSASHRNIRHVRIFSSVRRKGASNNSGVVEDGNFDCFNWIFVWKCWTVYDIYAGYTATRRLFCDAQMHDLE